MLFGGLASISAASKATSSKAIVQPEVIRAFTLAGFPWLMAEIYDEIIMDDESSATFSLDEELPPYHVHGLITSVAMHESMGRLSKELSDADMGLTEEESRIISLATGSHHDRLFLMRKKARELARELGLNPFSPLIAVTEAIEKRLIDMESYMNLSIDLLSWEGR